MKLVGCLVLILSFLCTSILAEENNTFPRFGITEPNYFITGLGSRRSSANPPLLLNDNNQVKFRIAIVYKILGSEANLSGFYLGYTQNSFWNIYDPSGPFLDNNYKPEIYLYLDGSKFWKGGTPQWYVPSSKFSIIHESNGLSGTNDRAWDRASFSLEFGRFKQTPFYATTSLWHAYNIAGNNRNIEECAGEAEIKLGAFKMDESGIVRYGATLSSRACFSEGFTGSELSFYYNPFYNSIKSWRKLPPLMAQFYWGRGESLLNYNKFSRAIRVGISFF